MNWVSRFITWHMWWQHGCQDWDFQWLWWESPERDCWGSSTDNSLHVYWPRIPRAQDIYSLSPAAYAVWEGMDAHLLVVYGFSIIKIVKVHQCYMDMIYDTMDKDGNINTFPLFGDINICTPKWPSLCHSICPDFSYCDRESWLWGYVFLWICSEGLCICWALIGRIFCSCIYHWCPSHFLPHWCCFLPRHNYVAGHQMQLRELLQLCHVHGQS